MILDKLVGNNQDLSMHLGCMYYLSQMIEIVIGKPLLSLM